MCCLEKPTHWKQVGFSTFMASSHDSTLDAATTQCYWWLRLCPYSASLRKRTVSAETSKFELMDSMSDQGESASMDRQCAFFKRYERLTRHQTGPVKLFCFNEAQKCGSLTELQTRTEAELSAKGLASEVAFGLN